MHHLEFGIVSDEVSPDFREAVFHAKEWRISIFELRVLRSGRVPNINTQELKEIRAIAEGSGLRISALSPGIFKFPLSQRKELEEELTTTLPKTLEQAQLLGASMVIVFGFQRKEGEAESDFSCVMEWMNRAAERAQQDGVKLIIENEPGFWCDSGANTAKLLRSVNSPFLRANWDPCNGYGTAERPFPDGYNAIREFVANVHVKDTKAGSLIACVPVGEGAIDWKGQLEALVHDGIVQHITIETHCLPLVEKSRQNVETLNCYLAEIYQRQEISK